MIDRDIDFDRDIDLDFDIDIDFDFDFDFDLDFDLLQQVVADWHALAVLVHVDGGVFCVA